MENETQLTYEEALLSLNRIVERLERGDIPLNDTVKYYEEGQQLLKLCREQLTAAEGRLYKLTEEGQIEKLNQQ